MIPKSWKYLDSERRVGMPVEEWLFANAGQLTYAQMCIMLDVSICTLRKWMRQSKLTKRLQVARITD